MKISPRDLARNRIALSVFTAALAACGPVAAAELASEVLNRVRDHVAAKWTVSGVPEAGTRIGFGGTFWPKAKGELPAKCDGGAVGVVTYTTTDRGVVCAVYPHRDREGAVIAKVVLSAPDEVVQEFDFPQEGGGLSERSGRGVLLYANSDNETPEMKAAAARSNAMAACQPRDIQQAIACLDTHWSEETKTEFGSLTANEVIRTHIGIGMWIRNNWGLWQGGALHDFFAAQNVKHPDDMSVLLLNAYWLKSHGCRAEWNDTAVISRAFSLALRGHVCSAN